MSASGLSARLGGIIREHRVRCGISQEELGFRADVHRTYVSMLERGLKSPTVETLFRLCLALQARPRDVIGELEQREHG